MAVGATPDREETSRHIGLDRVGNQSISDSDLDSLGYSTSDTDEELSCTDQEEFNQDIGEDTHENESVSLGEHLKIMYTNADVLLNKREELSMLLHSESPDIMAYC